MGETLEVDELVDVVLRREGFRVDLVLVLPGAELQFSGDAYVEALTFAGENVDVGELGHGFQFTGVVGLVVGFVGLGWVLWLGWRRTGECKCQYGDSSLRSE